MRVVKNLEREVFYGEAANPGFVDGVFEEAISFVEEANKIKIAGFAVTETLVKKEIGSFKRKGCFLV